MKRRAAYAAPVVLGLLFCFWYITAASDNVAYSDYIRLINSYLPDVDNPAKFFVPDILTRVPVTYLGRLINVKWLGYNTFFDLSLGVISLAAGAAALAAYGKRERRLGYIWFVLIQFVYFSLNKWEMLANGTGWVCFLSISGFIFHYVVLDEVIRNGGEGRRLRILLYVTPLVLTLLVAGPYCGGYSVILILTYTTLLVAEYRKNRRISRTWLTALGTVLLSLGFYLWSNSFAVYVHRGAVGGSIVAEFLKDPAFFLRFILKALASAVAGVGQLQALEADGGTAAALFPYVLGTAVAVMYLYALYLNVRYRLYEKTAFPLLMILSGGLNHLLIVAARWIFLNEEYGMSSRYEIQYQMGIIGILLTFALMGKCCGIREKAKTGRMAVIGLCTALVLWGNVWTTWAEIKTAPFRKDYLQISRELGLHYRTASDEELETYLHNSADAVRSAMRILEENQLNIFRK